MATDSESDLGNEDFPALGAAVIVASAVCLFLMCAIILFASTVMPSKAGGHGNEMAGGEPPGTDAGSHEAGKQEETAEPAPPRSEEPPSPDVLWGRMRANGSRGLMLMEWGREAYAKATSRKETVQACQEMVDGYNLAHRAIIDAVELREAIKQKEPEKDFSAWEEEITTWMAAIREIRKVLPLEYVDKLK